MVECRIPLIEAGRHNHAPTCRADAASTANTSSRRSGSRTLPTASLRWACAKSSVRLTEGVVRRGGLHMRLLISHPPNHTTASIGNSWWTTWLRPPRAGRTGGEWAPRRLVGGEGLGDVCIRKTARLGWYVDTRTHANLLSLPTGLGEAHLTAASIPEVYRETGGLGEKEVLWTKYTSWVGGWEMLINWLPRLLVSRSGKQGYVTNGKWGTYNTLYTR